MALSPGTPVDKDTKVLVVEDETPLRDLLREELTRSGYQVETATDGFEGLAKYGVDLCDVVLLDLRMPGMDGIEALWRMRCESTVPEVIVCTGNGTLETAIACIRQGACDYLIKPVKLEELEHVIAKAAKKNRCRREKLNLRQEDGTFESLKIVGKSTAHRKVLNIVTQCGRTDGHVVITGESGTGKELMARAVHAVSSRAGKPLVTVNCGRLNSDTAESELFGHMPGAFTDAGKERAGLFEQADTGTLFMDEISEMPLAVQVKLLRILDTGTFRRLGGNRDIRVDVRFVFASNKNLQECVNREEFRADLFHRINLLPVTIPPLRERKEDVLPLTRFFLTMVNPAQSDTWELAEDAAAALHTYDWPGNVRELRNTIRRACILAPTPAITLDLLPSAILQSIPSPVPLTITPVGIILVGTSALSLQVVEKGHILQVLDLVDGNKSKAARILEIHRKTLYAKLDQYRLA